MSVVTITTADCVGWLSTLPTESVDCAVYDPPYYMGKKPFVNSAKRYTRMVEEWDNQWESKEEYLAWCSLWIVETYRVLKPGGAFLVFGSMHNIFDLYTLIRDMTFDKSGKSLYNVKNMITWCVANAPPIFMAKQASVYAYSSQYVVYATKEGKVNYFDYELLKERNGGVQMRDWIVHNQEITSNRVGHPTQKPEHLMRLLLEVHCPPNGTVIDAFGGSGTTAMSAVNLDRKVHIADISSDYTHMARTRLVKYMVDQSWEVHLDYGTESAASQYITSSECESHPKEGAGSVFIYYRKA